MSEIGHGYADLGGLMVHYLTAGEGDAVVLLHGIPQTSYAWRHVMPRLAERFRVIAPDLRGLGDTSRPAGGYDKKTIAADVWGLLQGHLGVERFFLVGHDWGGPVAFALAARHREAVRGLAILDVTIPGAGADFSQGGRRWHHALFRTLDLPEAIFADRADILLNWFFDHYAYRPDAIAESERREYLRTYTKPGALRAMFEYYRALPTDAADTAAILAEGRLAMPVLALGGDKAFGRGLEPLDSLRALADDVRGGLVSDCGHWLAEEAPDAVAHELTAFFVHVAVHDGTR